MKLTCQQWTDIQNRLPLDLFGDLLWHKLEAKTQGKLYSQNVAIRLGKDEQEVIDAALAEIAKEVSE